MAAYHRTKRTPFIKEALYTLTLIQFFDIPFPLLSFYIGPEVSSISKLQKHCSIY